MNIASGGGLRGMDDAHMYATAKAGVINLTRSLARANGPQGVAQLIQIGPGERAQRLHRDEEAWSNIPKNSPDLEVEAMIALTDFTVENGATGVVPGTIITHIRQSRAPPVQAQKRVSSRNSDQQNQGSA